MPEEITEKKIRARLADKQTRFGDNSIRHLLSIIDEQRGTIAMHEAGADEAALKAARREARIQELIEEKRKAGDWASEYICYALLNEIEGAVYGENPVILGTELRNLRAQVAEARAAGHHPNLFEWLADGMKANWWMGGGQ